MALLPNSWRLKTRQSRTGQTEIVERDATGRDVVVKRVDHITDQTLNDLQAGDREHSDAYKFVKHVMAPGERAKAERETRFQDGLMEAASRMRHGLQCWSPGSPRQSFIGFCDIDQDKWDRVFGCDTIK